MKPSVFSKLWAGMSKHSPEILTGVGIAGMLSSTILAIKATPKAMEKIQARCEEEQVDELSFGEKVKTTITCYIPTIITSVVSSGCVVAGLSVNLRRNAGLALATSVAETTLHEYQNRVIGMIGEEKNREVMREVSQARAEKAVVEVPKSEQKVILTGNGNTLCLDSMTGRYFKADVSKIDKALNAFNKDLRNEMYKPLNDFYMSLGLPTTDVGDILGVFIDRGYLDITYSSQLTDDHEPVLVLVYDLYPIVTRNEYHSNF